MRKILSTILACALFTVVSGCGKSAEESIMSDKISKMKEQVAILKDVKDDASAKAAAPKLKAINDALVELGKKEQAVSKPEDQVKVMEKYGKEFTEVTAELTKETMRVISDPKLGAAMK